MELKVGDRKLIFKKVELKFNEDFYENVYSLKNNKTVAETLEHSRYRKFRNIIYEKYSDYLDWALGEFLFMLKGKGDVYYKSFLNKYGDSIYSHFWIDDHSVLDKKGLYAYKVGDELKYIGRCLDNFQRRINLGYGKIHPKNCYLDGQATNCHLNSLITQNRDSISLWICPLDDDEKIMKLESSLIRLYSPEWNIASVSSYNAIKPIKIAGGNKMVKVRRKENPMEGNEKFEGIWNRIVENAGERFFTKTGKPFTYEIVGSMFIPSRTEYAISKADIMKAYKLVPISGPGQISQLVRGPSYLWAVLHDEMISKGEW